MKLTTLISIVCLLATSSFAASPVVCDVPSHAAPASVAHAPWSVVGIWHCTHPGWHDVLTLNTDGSFSREQGDAGQWRLEAQQGRVVLVLAWKDWASETVIMYGPDDFQGKIHKDDIDEGEMALHRVVPPVAKP